MNINNNYNIINGDCFSILSQLPANYYHAIVTDPPYNFKDGVMKGANWDDVGTPKEYQEWCEKWATESLKTLKPGGHIIAFGGNRSHHRLMSGLEDAGYEIRDTIVWIYGTGMPKAQPIKRWLHEKYKDEFGDWRGMLKPATEFAILARAPMNKSSSKNQMEHGTGNLNVEACRIGDEDGRFPANVIIDEVMSQAMDLQSGISLSSGGQEVRGFGSSDKYGDGKDKRYNKDPGYGDVGGASRFFYCPKSSKSERTHDGNVNNSHETVKPVKLIQYLIRLVTSENQNVLDPFAGSGTTGLASSYENRNFTLIEKKEDYFDIIKNRLEHENINYYSY